MWTWCDRYATATEIRDFLNLVASLNASRGLFFTVAGKWTPLPDMFTRVANILLYLTIWDYPNLTLSVFQRASIHLPQLVALQLWSCSNIEVRQSDFTAFPALREFMAGGQSTFKSIQSNSFDNLLHLRHLTIEQGFNLNQTLPLALAAQLRLLHCSPEYRWLRDFLDERPFLIAAKGIGEIWNMGGMASEAHAINDNFISFDCDTDSVIMETNAGFSRSSEYYSLAKCGYIVKKRPLLQ